MLDDETGEALMQRADDTEAALVKRLEQSQRRRGSDSARPESF